MPYIVECRPASGGYRLEIKCGQSGCDWRGEIEPMSPLWLLVVKTDEHRTLKHKAPVDLSVRMAERKGLFLDVETIELPEGES